MTSTIPQGTSAAVLRRMMPDEAEVDDGADEEAQAVSKSLKRFIRAMWPLIEPTQPLVWGWHLDAICEHLEAVSRREVLKLLINVPPRYLKSTCVNVGWPAWEWLTRPEERYLSASYAAELAVRDAVKTRRLMQSEGGGAGTLLQRVGYRGVLRLLDMEWDFVGDQNVKSRYENSRTGHRIATGIGGGATGEGGSRVIVDDPHKLDEWASETKRKEAVEFVTETVPSRLNTTDAATVVIMQRVHEADVSGVLIEQGDWTHLCLPALYEPSHPFLWPDDPRTEAGEPLLPGRHSAEYLDARREAIGPRKFAGQYAQNPIPLEGAMFQRDWFEVVGAAPNGLTTVRYWDLAGSTDGDWTSGAKVGYHRGEGCYYVLDVTRKRRTPGGVRKLVSSIAQQDSKAVPVWIEQDPGQAGKDQIQSYASMPELNGFTVKGNPPTGSKIVRAEPVSARAELGQVKLVRGEWNAAFLDEADVFPLGEHDDQIDAVSGAFSILSGKKPIPDVGPVSVTGTSSWRH